MTKMAARPIHGKNPKKSLLHRNGQVNFHRTWYEASETPAHYSLANDDRGVTLTYFTARSNLIILALQLENGKTVDISETYLILFTSDSMLGKF